MENRVTLFLIILFSSVLFFSLASYMTGGAVNLDRLGNSNPRSNLDHSKLVVYPQVVKAGGIVTVDIYPSKSGVFTGLAVYNPGNLRKFGNICNYQSVGDFCSNVYQCIDSSPERCTVTGTKCYGAKRMMIRTNENWNPGIYTMKVCDAVGECQDCTNPSTTTFTIE